ncbi:MAG: chorismate synthase [Candidatus Terraquivivens tikiterensis]|uniref:Chorismate synthase n=1 Tax=Candidatus Terraquivivens tikiterensis TaxID=1980982 RepID=A0A2R7Y6M2_9ARCH|nr:MAG: chorismate synthase [Candidatus Terraquivivens tikiterensis]
MAGNVIGERFVVVSFGESHGRCVGAVVDGCPAGLELSEADIQRELDLRRPGVSSLSSPRAEEDKVEILSGVFEGRTTGSPICMLVWNRDVDSEPYRIFVNRPRPGHADYVARMKYGGFADWRGGGRFSGRITAGFVMAGAVAKKLLSKALNVEIMAYALEIGGIRARRFTLEDIRRKRYTNEARCPDESAAAEMIRKINEVKSQGDSLGGIVECQVFGLPAGLGEPVFSSLDSDLSRALFAIPAVKGVEFGVGFEAARLLGSQNNDPYAIVDGKVITTTNNAGGILGGMSTGMPLVLRVAFKPPPSIAKKQKTIDLGSMKEVEIVVGGRHDPTVVPRAVPVVEAVVAIVLADHAIRAGFIPPVIRD